MPTGINLEKLVQFLNSAILTAKPYDLYSIRFAADWEVLELIFRCEAKNHHISTSITWEEVEKTHTPTGLAYELVKRTIVSAMAPIPVKQAAASPRVDLDHSCEGIRSKQGEHTVLSRTTPG